MNWPTSVESLVTESKQRGYSYSPWDPGHVVGEYPECVVDDIDVAVARAHQAWPVWASLSAPSRASYLRRVSAVIRERKEVIAETLSLEAGKSSPESVAEVGRMAHVLDYSASLVLQPDGSAVASGRAGVRLMSRRFPLGVVGVVTPFNFPAFVPSLKLGPALAAGNCVVWKPAPQTPVTSLMLHACFVDAGIPAGVLEIVTGTDIRLGARVVEHELVEAISFTGSTKVGREIINSCSALLKPVQAEMGGVNPLIVMDGVALDKAVLIAREGAFSGAGQKCTSTSIIFVHEDIYTQFSVRLLESITEMSCNDREKDGVGPLISESARARIHAQVDGLRNTGAQIMCGGAVPAGDLTPSWFYPPTVIADIPTGCLDLEEEVFGPVVQLQRFNSLEEVLSLLRNQNQGLAAGLVSERLADADSFSSQIRAGLLSINLPTTGVEPQVSFGGVGHSGWGPRELGPDACAFYTEERSFAVRARL